MTSARPRLLLGIVAAYPFWLAMQAVHEFGHVLHAWFSGGVVRRVEIPWFGFSFTELSHNPAPGFVAAGGFAWGPLLPLIALGAAWIITRRRSAVPFQIPLTRGVAAFAGFCLVANGAYMASAIVEPVGDAAELVRAGVPPWLFGLTGAGLVSGGVGLWHFTTHRPSSGK